MKRAAILCLSLMLLSTGLNAQTNFRADKGHSIVGFKVKHFMISTVTGRFTDFEINVSQKGKDFENAEIDVKIMVNSITTENKRRDNHLRSSDFFAVEEFPEITFKSKSMKKVGEGLYKLIGEFTMRGVTKTIELDAEFGGQITQRGRAKAGFHTTGF